MKAQADQKADAYFAARDALKRTKIKDVEAIAKLPWHGNHASDMGLFTACENFIQAQKSKAIQKRALFLMGKHGMGIAEPVTDAILQETLQFWANIEA